MVNRSAEFGARSLKPRDVRRSLASMTDEEVTPFVGKPVRVTLADGGILAGVLYTDSSHGHGHGHHHYMVASAPVREGEEGAKAVIHGAGQITQIEDASDDPAARL